MVEGVTARRIRPTVNNPVRGPSKQPSRKMSSGAVQATAVAAETILILIHASNRHHYVRNSEENGTVDTIPKACYDDVLNVPRRNMMGRCVDTTWSRELQHAGYVRQ